MGPWEQRGTRGSFVQLAGQEGWTQICVQEIAPGGTSKPFKMAIDELIFFAREALRSALRKVHITELERKHREGYHRKPVKRGEFRDWEPEQVWVE